MIILNFHSDTVFHAYHQIYIVNKELRKNVTLKALIVILVIFFHGGNGRVTEFNKSSEEFKMEVFSLRRVLRRGDKSGPLVTSLVVTLVNLFQTFCRARKWLLFLFVRGKRLLQPHVLVPWQTTTTKGEENKDYITLGLKS